MSLCAGKTVAGARQLGKDSHACWLSVRITCVYIMVVSKRSRVVDSRVRIIYWVKDVKMFPVLNDEIIMCATRVIQLFS